MEIVFEEIANREYSVKGQLDKILVAIGKPQKFSNSTDYYCPYKIIAFGKEDVRQIFGADAFQAINLALKTVDAELRRIVKKKSVELKWLGGSFTDSPFPG